MSVSRRSPPLRGLVLALAPKFRGLTALLRRTFGTPVQQYRIQRPLLDNATLCDAGDAKPRSCMSLTSSPKEGGIDVF